MRRRLALAGALALLVLSTVRALAAGPLFVNDAGEPLVWQARPVPWSSDRGGLGVLDETAARQLVEDAFALWAAVPTASISFSDAGALPVDVGATDVGLFIGVCDDGLSPIVFDTDGTITDALFGAGASNSILGFAGPECGSFSPPAITEASAVLNGKFIDGIASGGNPEVDLDTFRGVMIHELGHYVNLDHSQINLIEAFDGTTAGDDAIATMFPFVVSGAETATLARDDEVSLSVLYPAADFRTTTATITGEVRRGDIDAPFRGAFVIARNVDDPRRDAVGWVSGARYVPGSVAPEAAALVGAYELAGLTPDGRYTVEIEAVSRLFTGGSSVGPLSPPATLPGPPEQWSGDDEAATNPPDDPSTPGVEIPVAAGELVSGVDVVLNVTPPPANDVCDDATDVTSFPFTTTIETRLATSAADDPTPSCVVTPNPKASKSVWFRLVSPLAGTLTLSTAGSDYDTVLAAFTGTCGAVAGVGCNDDGPSGFAAVLTLPVAADTPYLVGVTDFASTGGTLVFTATFELAPPPACRAGAPGECIPGTGAPRTDCVTEWFVQPVPPLTSARPGARNVPRYRASCVDGDPRCDFDGSTAKNGRCVFHVAICANNVDPRPAARRCIPSALGEYRLLAPSIRRPRDAADAANAAKLLAAVAGLGVPPAPTVSDDRVAFAPALATLDRCTTLQPIVVPIGTRVLRSRALTPGKRSDTDQLRLRCLQ
ncbi:MAG: hypothetical protein IT293_17145 [Deltaproteobacteria bacterium]|nr:hypothetical protein [Deltaproteobacteria bacterium]